MQQSVVYSNGNQECERAVSLLRSLGHDFHEYMVGEDFTQTEFEMEFGGDAKYPQVTICLLYTSPSPRDKSSSRMPSSA